MQLPSLLKNRSVQIGLGIVLIVVLIAIFSGGNVGNDTLIPTPSSSSSFQISNLNEEKKAQAEDYRKQISSSLPIYVEDFRTSVGLDTTINIYHLNSDPTESVRLEIYGLSYLNPEVDPVKNPNVVAFKESYLEALRLMAERGIDPSKLIFIYSDRESTTKTINIWLESLNLSP